MQEGVFPPVFLDNSALFLYNEITAAQTYLRGAGVPAEIGLAALTREPDTVSTVVGKDAR